MKQRFCEKCGEFLPEDAPYWKTLCYRCYKYMNFKKGKRIGAVMSRLGESEITRNQGRRY